MMGPQQQTYAYGLAAVIFLGAFFVYFFSPRTPQDTMLPPPDPAPTAASDSGLVYRPDGMGIRFTHQQARVLTNIAHVTGSGVCIADFDGDDQVDVFLVNGTLEGSPDQREHALFLNRGAGQFIADDDAGGIRSSGLNMGAVAADYDGDGDQDLYISRIGPDRLFRNDGSGRFEDVTTVSQIHAGGWGTAVAWADYDRDDDLDLFVANYVRYDPQQVPTHNLRSSDRDDLAPFNPYLYESEPDQLFRNNGDGTFTDVTREAGIDDPDGKGLGALFVDLNDDTWPDLYVVNDVSPNRLYLNQQDGKFRDTGMLAGIDDPRSGMGVAIADTDGDGRWDLFSTHWQDELNVLYCHAGDFDDQEPGGVPLPLFDDVTARRGLARHGLGLGLTGWGAVFFDADHDGDVDLYWTNGYTSPAGQSSETCVRQPDFFAMYDAGRYRLAPEPRSHVPAGAGRGLAAADLDGDGDLDLIRTDNNGPAVVIENRLARGHWLIVKPVGRLVVGTRIRISTKSGPQQRVVLAGDSFLSCGPPEVHFGLGSEAVVDRLEVRWPDGVQRVWENVSADQRFIAHREP